jgi:hypothetical protein
VQALSDFRAADPGSASLGLALALVFACAAPTWAALPLAAKLSRWVGRRYWLRLLGVAYIVPAQTLGWLGYGRAYHKMIGPSRPTEQAIVEGAWVANLLLFLFSVGWVDKWLRRRSAAPSKPQLKKRSLTLLAVVLQVWVALWGAYAFERVCAPGATPLSDREWIVLGSACLLTAILAWVLIINSREARRTAAKQGGGPMGG